MRKDKTVAIILSILASLPLIYWIGVIGLFRLDMKVIKMKDINLKGKDYDLCIYYNPSNATVEESIQIHLVSKEGGEDKLYKHYVRYNKFLAYEVNTDTLVVVLQRNEHTLLKVDTLVEKLPVCYGQAIH